jgi:hypothetical protein
VLPNLLTVGAVDKAGDEAPFTSYGPTVVVHANGYQVDSYLPGGQRVALVGHVDVRAAGHQTSRRMMLAVNPALAPPEVIRIIRDTADKTADGRRVLVNRRGDCDRRSEKKKSGLTNIENAGGRAALVPGRRPGAAGAAHSSPRQQSMHREMREVRCEPLAGARALAFR